MPMQTLARSLFTLCGLLPALVTAEMQPVEVTDAYVRGLPPGQTVTAAFMQIKNPNSCYCTLVDASSPQATGAEVHQHFRNKKGMMAMRPVPSLDIDGGEQLSLQPSGYHLMLFGLETFKLKKPMIELTLIFDRCPNVQLQVPVKSVLDEE